MITVFFNGWHSLVDFGGCSREQLNSSFRNTPGFGPHRQHLRELLDAVHPYWIWRIPAQTQAKNFAKRVEHRERLGKPALATECCWGSNDDATRVQYIRHDLGRLKRAGIGFLPHALHHSPVADLHRPVPGRKWETMHMGFIEPDGTTRRGHEAYNEYCS